MFMKKLAILATAMLFLMAAGRPVNPGLGREGGRGRGGGERGNNQDQMNRYIVTMKDSSMPMKGHRLDFDTILAPNDTITGARGMGRSAGRMVKSHSRGYTAELSPEELVKIMELEEVESIEPDGEITAAQFPIELGWHTDRIDQRNLPLDNIFDTPLTGKGVDIYILDSGIRYSHEVFEGRAKYGGYDHYGSTSEDCQGHGTHVAGLAGGKITGTASQANLYSIRVLDCNKRGSVSGLLTAIDQVIDQAQKSGRPTVMSLSIVAPKSPSINHYIKAAYQSGVVTVAAAGNYKKDACNYSPASAPEAITVGGTSSQDGLYWYTSSGTNFGSCVDIMAPAVSVRSASHQSDDSLVSKTGTSMAAPLVSGAVALILEENPKLSPDEVKEKLLSAATKDVIDFSSFSTTPKKTTPNLLLYVGSSKNATTPEPVTEEPTTPPTTATTPSTTPTTPPTVPQVTGPFPLPEELSKMTAFLNMKRLPKALEKKETSGFVPTNVNTYMWNGAQRFSVVFTYVGVENIMNYITLIDLSIEEAENKVKEFSNYQPITLAPYTVNNEVKMILVLAKTDSDIKINFETPESKWEAEREARQTEGYYPIVMRYRLGGDKTQFVYTIYKKNEWTFLLKGLNYKELSTKGYNQVSLQKYIIDVTFRKDGSSGEIEYSAILNRKSYGKEQVYIDNRFDVTSFVRTYNILRKSGFSMVAMTPLPEPTFEKMAFMGVYWL